MIKPHVEATCTCVMLLDKNDFQAKFYKCRLCSASKALYDACISIHSEIGHQLSDNGLAQLEKAINEAVTFPYDPKPMEKIIQNYVSDFRGGKS